MFSFLRSLYWRARLGLGGARVGKNFRVDGTIHILLRDGASYGNVSIGSNVRFTGTTHIRIRSEGKLEIADGVRIGHEVWLVAANSETLSIGCNTQLGSYSIINAGHGVSIGAQCWFAAFVYVNSSDHAFAAGQPICSQGFVGAPIVIGDDNWIGGHVFISKGVTTGQGVVLGAGTILTKDAPANAIMVGNPGRLLRYRT